MSEKFSIVRNSLIILFFLLQPFLASNTFSQEIQDTTSNASQVNNLLLIPTPQKVIMKSGSFDISKSDKIVLADHSNKDDNFSAKQLLDEIDNDLNIKLTLSAKHGHNYFLIGQIGRDRNINEAIKESGIDVPSDLNDEGYILNITPSSVIVAGKSSAGTFYGVQTLKQIIRSNRKGFSIPCLTIIDWPGLHYRGWMDDISRGPIPNMNLLKKEVRVMSEYKQNFFNLYTEYVFKLKSYPELAPEDGLTADQVKELSDYASQYHIQLIGNFQSFGHMYHILKSPFYHNMRETENILNPASEATYKFLKKAYSEVVPAYDKSNFFNINCDETFGLGQGKAKAMVDSLGLGEVYAYHINRIYNLLKPYHKRIMMWGDIAVNNASIIKELPKNLIVLSWGYSPDSSFDNAIIPFKKAGFDFMVAPGVSCWSRIWPGMRDAVINIYNYVRDGAKFGAIGMMNTAWDDDGENLFNYNWHGLIWGAECSWKPPQPSSGEQAKLERNTRLKSFNKAFDATFYGNSKAGVAKALFDLDSLRYYPIRNLLDDSGFWDDVVDYDSSNTSDSAMIYNSEVENKVSFILGELSELKNVIQRNNSTLDYAIFAAKRVLVEARKNIFRVELSREMKNPEKGFEFTYKQNVDSLMSELHGLQMEYTCLWERENRTWWLDHILARYNKLGNNLLYLDQKVFINPANSVADSKRIITLNTLFNDKPIYYTTDGTVPTLGANIYTKPFTINHSTIIRACVFENDQPGELSESYVLVDKAIGKLYKLVSMYSDYNPAYSAGGDSALVDGLLGSLSYRDGRWQGFQGQDLNVILDLKKETKINEVSIRFLQSSSSYIFFPSDVKILFSDDGKNFHLGKEIKNTIDPSLYGTVVHKFTADFDNTEARYIQVIGVNSGNLLKGSHIPKSQCFLFSDEVTVN